LQLRAAGAPRSIWLDETMVAGALGLALTHALRAVIRRRGWLRAAPRPLGIRLAASALVLAVMQVGVVGAVEAALFKGPSIIALAFAVVRWTMAFLVWEGAYVSFSLLDARQRDATTRAQLEAAVRAAELRALEARLNPHFLFNALNSVRALIGDQPDKARDAITRLARMLRYTLAIERAAIVSLDRELEVVHDYLGIEQLRLDARLHVETDVDGAGAAQLPPLILQTLVENAIKHGIARLPSGGTVRLAAKLANNVLVIEIENPRSTAVPPADSTGFGLASARERLRLVYGDRAALDVDLSAPDRAKVRLVVPQGVAA
jgi:LytS/YehU family sensor histidine kinase